MAFKTIRVLRIVDNKAFIKNSVRLRTRCNQNSCLFYDTLVAVLIKNILKNVILQLLMEWKSHVSKLLANRK